MPNSTKKIKHDEEEYIDENEDVGNIVGLSTGEETTYNTIAGGWEGTDDATSTAPSDISPSSRVHREKPKEDPDCSIGRAYAGGIGPSAGGIADIKGTPVEDSRDWEEEPIVDQN